MDLILNEESLKYRYTMIIFAFVKDYSKYLAWWRGNASGRVIQLGDDEGCSGSGWCKWGCRKGGFERLVKREKEGVVIACE